MTELFNAVSPSVTEAMNQLMARDCPLYFTKGFGPSLATVLFKLPLASLTMVLFLLTLMTPILF